MPFLSRRSRRTLFPAVVRRVDRRVGKRIYRAATPGPVNSSFFALSSNADRGLFWAAIVALVAVSGEKGRRAALRGMLSLGASSVLANFGAKKVIRAPRPLLRGVTHRHLNHTPTSPSFPSGHTATAAALATGIWIVSPRRGVIVALVAAAIGYSRLHVGAHWLSDVIVGNLLGVAVGLVGAAIIPTRDKRAKRDSPRNTSDPAPSSA